MRKSGWAVAAALGSLALLLAGAGIVGIIERRGGHDADGGGQAPAAIRAAR